ncbi:hypothetical protein GCM10010123_46470 [Pilimelia anulata]|uniref:AB hydrolase-1 domain-containing protein n=1 Tax=Pilimelia anulata TaxID=53371 RepID=A0A8J3FDH5_9ACTN|nr:hypothetical protein GCM10010123_46470 [Pilimelia anulata]
MWEPVAALLARARWSTVTPAAWSSAPTTAEDVLQSFLAVLPAAADIVVLAHSNAGLYVPALTTTRRVVGCVFVDAGLPAGHGRVRLAPPAVEEFLRDRADEHGLLPPWTRWWSESEVASLFPDDATRLRVEREQQRLPLSYFAQSLAVPSGWDNRPGAYLAFGDTYAAERHEATQRGWPVTTLAGRHLHTLTAPRQVAEEINALLGRMGIKPPP